MTPDARADQRNVTLCRKFLAEKKTTFNMHSISKKCWSTASVDSSVVQAQFATDMRTRNIDPACTAQAPKHHCSTDIHARSDNPRAGTGDEPQ
ncbi:hypothetical protein [Pseudomonas sp.]|uniref:hypothetical protein n=1 Tax=Pseudomonas sp. TaxID=306 RepID=UPI002FC5AE98